MSSLVAAAPGVYLREALAEIRKSARLPQFVVPTIALPPAFYALFALAMNGGSEEMATRLLATYGVFAVMGPALFGFGANVAAERESGELELKRLSPMPAGAHIAAKLFATVVFSVIAFALIYGLAILAGVRLTQVHWALLAAVHVGAVVPFSLIGLVIGYRFGQKAAIAIANVAFLGLAVLGGLWMPVTFLPQAIQAVAWVLPSWHLGEIALMVVGMADASNLWLHAGPLGLITVAACVMAWTSQDSNPA
jgi:ABC-2 type transport system permease protein